VRARAAIATLCCVRLPLVLLVTCVCLFGCTKGPPPRSVLERDIDGYRFRRYQQVLDVELPIPENPAVGHAATYVSSGSPVRVYPVLVTQYTQPSGLVDALRQSLRGMEGYTFEVVEMAGAHVWQVQGGSGDRWWLWVHDAHLVKVGAAEGTDTLPEPLVRAYLAVYPSDLDEDGYGPKHGASSSGTPHATP
jgi:hypothetical protein